MSRGLLAGAALAFVALTLCGCGGGKSIPPIGSFYLDKSLSKPGTLAGWRLITDDIGIKESNDITIMGTDDGYTFWNVHGKWTDKDNGKFEGNFEHRGDGTQGYHNAEGTLSDDGITFNTSMKQDFGSTQWVTMENSNEKLVVSQSEQVKTKPGGLYKDITKYKEGTWEGIRMISDNYFPNITIVGTDDGKKFWKVLGRWDNVSGQFIVDFSPMDGPKNVTGTPKGTQLLWGDGAYWPKMNATSGNISAEILKAVQV